VTVEIINKNGKINCIIINLQFLPASSHRLMHLEESIFLEYLGLKGISGRRLEKSA